MRLGPIQRRARGIDRDQFRALELERLKDLLKQPLLVDLRNLYVPERVAAAGFRYVSVGRPEAKS